MFSVNIKGRLTKDPETRVTPTGTELCLFTVAVDDRNKDKTTSFVNCIAFKDNARFIQQYFSKGQEIAVVGTGRNRKWTTNKGEERITFEVTVNTAEFCGSKQQATTIQAPAITANTADFQPIADNEDLPF